MKIAAKAATTEYLFDEESLIILEKAATKMQTLDEEKEMEMAC